jgi:basic membrane protein A
VAGLTAAVTALVSILIPEPPPDLVILYDGPGDGAIGDMIATGLERARVDFDLEIEEVHGDGSLISQVTGVIDRGAPVVMLESLDADRPPFRDLLAANPETTFVLIDCIPGSQWPDNATCISARNVEMGYIAGVASGLASTNGSVGFIGGVDIPVIHEFQAGFEQGVRFVDPAIEISSGYLTGWNGLDFDFSGFASFTLAELMAQIQISEGADVLFPAAGGSAWGAFRAAGRAAESGQDVWVLGVDFDMVESFDAYVEFWELDREVADVDRSRILTSVLKRLDIGVYEAISQYVAGDQIPPIELTMANGGIGYSTTGGRFDSWAAQLDDAISAVTGGDIVLDLNRQQPTVLLSDLMGQSTAG